MKANPEHLDFLTECIKDPTNKGSASWNEWRENHPEIEPQLCNINFCDLADKYNRPKEGIYVDFSRFDFKGTNFEDANLAGMHFVSSNLKNANFRNANLEGANLESANLKGTSFVNAKLRHVNFSNSTGDFEYDKADFGGGEPEHIIRFARMGGWDNEAWQLFRKEEPKINLQGAFLTPEGDFKFYYQFDFSNVNLSDTVITHTNLSRCNFRNANLRQADLRKCELHQADLSEADLTEARLDYSVLIESDFTGANLSNASIAECNLTRANFTRAKLTKANLSQSVLIETIFDKADLSGSQVYGISAWDVSLKDTVQNGLVIVKEETQAITVDDLEVAQFIYLLINNEKIRSVIHTVTSKAVLILGRFYKERKDVLDALREHLKQYDLAPIIFDFKPSENRDLTETVQLLANMSKFVIADLTDAKSIPQELAHIIPFFPSIPVRPILLESERAYAMFEHWEKFDSVLPVFYYKDQDHLIRNIESNIIKPIDDWKHGRSVKSDAEETLKAQRKRFEELKLNDPAKYKELQDLGIIA